jgi:hypothetical protein
MGNSTSTTKKAESQFNNFYEIVDYIATYYILTMDFKSLSKLSEKAYCDKLVVLTSDIISRYFNDMEVTFLAQRIKEGVEVNDLKTEKIRFINQDNLQSLDVSNDTQKSIRKKRVCIGIAKYYVKIAHVFAAIVMTINPVYTYKDSTGQTVKTTLLEKDKIPKNVNRKLYKLNICDNRIRALKKGEIIDDQTGNVTIQPRVCDMNIDKNGTQKSLADEPGIQELMRLYLDDNYDYSNGSFTGMSPETEKQFRKDLKLFYTAFTGNEEMPDTIKKFSDIKLRDYSKKPGCQPPNSVLKAKYTINKKDELYVKYAENIKKMIQTAADNQYKLLEVINELFTYVNDPYSGKRVIRINPKLTDTSLQKAVEKTRKLIIDLYIKCESDYVNGVQLFEAIVESKIVETTQKQIENLKKEASKIISQTKKASEPSKQPAVVIVDNNTGTNVSSNTSPISTIPSSNTSSTMPITSNTSNTSPITPITSSTSSTSSITPITSSTSSTSSITPITSSISSITPITSSNTSTTMPITSTTSVNSSVPYSTNNLPSSIQNNPSTSIQNSSLPSSIPTPPQISPPINSNKI